MPTVIIDDLVKIYLQAEDNEEMLQRLNKWMEKEDVHFVRGCITPVLIDALYKPKDAERIAGWLSRAGVFNTTYETYVSPLKFDQISSCESSNHVGVRVFVAIPTDRKMTQDTIDKIRNHGNKLYELVNHDMIMNDPQEIERRTKEKKNLISLFGNEIVFVEEIPNEYCPTDTTWLLVTTRIGRIKIGWRKRVMLIDWSGSLNKTEANALFPEEDVTKYDRCIHAWDDEKAIAYLEKIINYEPKIK